MAETTTRVKPVAKTSASHQPAVPTFRVPTPRFASVVDRTSELSEEVLESLEAGERAAIEALGQFLVTVEEAVPQEVAATSDVAKKLTESGLQVVDRLVHVGNDVARNVIASAAKSLSMRDGKSAAA